MRKVTQKLLLLPIFLLSLLSLHAQDYIYEIQLATYASPEYKKFKSLHSIGYVYAIEMENSLSKIYMGTYSKKSTADRKLGLVKKKGYKDAFLVKKALKEEDAVYIVQMATYDQQSDIYWPDWQRLTQQLTVQLSDDKVRVAAGPYYTLAEAEAAQERIQVRGPKDVFVKKVSSEALHKATEFDFQRSPSYGQTSGGVRNSIKALQAILVSENLYFGEPNGALSPSTKQGIIKYKKTNERYVRHRRMAEDLVPENEIEEYTLQYYINMIPNDAHTAAAGLEQFKNPISKVYLAYIYLNEDVAIKDKTQKVNSLMNEALSDVFKRFKGKTRYDFSMKYSYEDVGQLISHLKAMYEVVKDRPDMPCWLFNRHPDECKKVFQPYWHSSRDEYTVSIDCGSFMDMEEMRILLVISKEFASDEKPIEGMNAINKLFVVPQPISHKEIEELEKWNGKLWKNLKDWSQGSPLQQNMYSLLRFAYYDALQSLETHFMFKGMPGLEARSLGLKILKASVGCNLDEYCNKN